MLILLRHNTVEHFRNVDSNQIILIFAFLFDCITISVILTLRFYISFAVLFLFICYDVLSAI